jgi:predicted RNase H-like HicB family nuclease
VAEISGYHSDIFPGETVSQEGDQHDDMPVVLKPAQRKLTAIIEPAEGVYVAFCPELDLATEADTPDSAVDDLIEMALDYAEQYMADFDRFSQSPNRAAHAPYVQAILVNPTPPGVRLFFEN